MQKNTYILSLLTAFFLVLILSGCGSKGALYQIPESEVVVTDKVKKDESQAVKPQPKKSD